MVGGDLGGDRGRRIEYWPHSGRARQNLLAKSAVLPVVKTAAPATRDLGELELF